MFLIPHFASLEPKRICGICQHRNRGISPPQDSTTDAFVGKPGRAGGGGGGDGPTPEEKLQVPCALCSHPANLCQMDVEAAVKGGCSMNGGNRGQPNLCIPIFFIHSLFFNGFCDFNASTGRSSTNGHVVKYA